MYDRFAGRAEFVEVMVRQAHPGPKARPYRTLREKLDDARAYKYREGIPWEVLADHLDGRVHQAYGALFDPSFLIDSDGRIAFYNLWTHVPTLHRALSALLERRGRGVVLGGFDRLPHPLPTVAAGWPGIRRGLPQSYTDMLLIMPGMADTLLLGYLLKPLLAPVALRSKPLPAAVKIGLGVAGVGALALLAGRFRSK